MTKTERLFALLKTGRWVSMRACLEAAGFRYGARIYELRRSGCVIEVKKKGGAYFYRMVLDE